MRVLVLADKEKNECMVFEITSVWYDDDKGFSFHSLEGDYYYIPNISFEDYNYLCRKIFEYGDLDLTAYGECEYDSED